MITANVKKNEEGKYNVEFDFDGKKILLAKSLSSYMFKDVEFETKDDAQSWIDENIDKVRKANSN